MKRTLILAAALALCALPAAAQGSTTIMPTVALIQDKPSLIGTLNIYAMEEEAEKAWAPLIPKLAARDEYNHAWNRLQLRLTDVVEEWGKQWEEGPDRDADAKVWRANQEMWMWCSALEDKKAPEQKESAPKFAQLDVRVRVCNDTLPQPQRAPLSEAAKPAPAPKAIAAPKR